MVFRMYKTPEGFTCDLQSNLDSWDEFRTVRDIPRKGYTRYVTNLLFSDKIWKNQEIYSSENTQVAPGHLRALCYTYGNLALIPR